MSEAKKLDRSRWPREQIGLVLFIVAYVLTGWFGLNVESGHAAVTLVWPPAGIALGVLLVRGYRYWPFIAGGGVLLYSAALGPSIAVATIAAGDTATALFAAYLVNRYAGGRQTLHSPVNSLRFVLLTVLAGTSFGGTVAAASLVVTGTAPWSDYASIWTTWSIGNVTGTLLVAPAVVLFSQRLKGRWRTSEVLEASVVQLLVLLTGLVVFLELPVLRGHPLELLLAPGLLWVALRIGRRAAVSSVLVLTALAIYSVANGLGPFARGDFTTGVLIAQVYMSLLGVMTISLAALASEYSVAEAQLRELVVTAPLTGLPNYRRLLEELDAEILRCQRTKQTFAVIFFDMDDLKVINDEYGHVVGSRAVCRLAEMLRSVCRSTDTAARYGGDEFVAVLPETEGDGAEIFIRRLFDRLAKDPDEPKVTVSAGVAVYPTDGGTSTTLLSAADRALYVTKAEKSSARRRGVVPIRSWSRADSA